MNPSSTPHLVCTISPTFALLNVCSIGARLSAELLPLLQDSLKQPLRNRRQPELTLGDVLLCDIQASPYALSVFLTPVARAPATTWCGRLRQALLRPSFQEGVRQYLSTLRQRLDQPASPVA